MESQYGIVVAVVLLGAAMVVGLYVPARLTRRAMGQVVRRFYEHKALGARDAKSVDELGLTPPSFLQKMTRTRDYKPNALQVLQQVGAVQMTEEGKLYLVEEKLHQSLRPGGNR